MHNKDDFIEAMAKHLPPSAATLRLLDVGCVAGEILRELRPDIHVERASLRPAHWTNEANSVDAVVAYDLLLTDALLEAVLRVMRPGGRFIVVQPLGEPDAAHVETLEAADYTRILVEAAVDERGVLIRGEKAHTTDDTFERVQDVADRDADLLDLTTYRGRYVHLLVEQTPNKPVWKLRDDEQIHWEAVTVATDTGEALLAFSSLPKAVSFMQPAVMQGVVKDINKVGKFSKATAATWTLPVLLNPTLESVEGYEIQRIAIDPDTAEAPDE